jgi:hypothetical protein
LRVIAADEEGGRPENNNGSSCADHVTGSLS